MGQAHDAERGGMEQHHRGDARSLRPERITDAEQQDEVGCINSQERRLHCG